MKKVNPVSKQYDDQPTTGYKFNPNKSLSTEQLTSFKYNAVTKSGMKN